MDYKEKVIALLNSQELSKEQKERLEEIFPELAESEDEKIKKALISFLKSPFVNENITDEKVTPWIAWLENIPYAIDHEKREGFRLGYKAGLEKQGEQKSINDLTQQEAMDIAVAKCFEQGEQKPADANEEDNDFTIYHPIKNECSNKYECFPYSFYGSIEAFHNNEELLCFLRNCFYKKEDCEKWCREQNEQKPAWSEEDERIRKALIRFHKSTIDIDGIKGEDILAWLEKQGEQKTIDGLTPQEAMDIAVAKCFNEQKPADKVEPKFKVGNWYQCTKDFFGKGVTFDKNTAYYCAKEGCLQGEYGCHIAIVKDLYDNFKLWTIQDAKDGDVLATEDLVFIFKKINSNGKPTCYCHYDIELGFRINTNSYIATGSEIYPATKEQRDILEKAMAEAGYTFDFEKKELKKIEQKPAWNEKYIADVFEKVGLAKIVREQSNDNLTNALQSAMIELSKFTPQPKQEWSEEDNQMIKNVQNDYHNRLGAGIIPQAYHDKVISWLKSLKERYTWKPSDEQIQALEYQVHSTFEGSWQYKASKELLEQLKKL